MPFTEQAHADMRRARRPHEDRIVPAGAARRAELRVTGPRSEVPAVSVIVPAYNEAERLPHTLPRLLDEQILLPGTLSELIVVDDGSEDGTAQVAAHWLRDRENARVLRLPWHAGKGAAVRYGVASARGEVILFMDADLATDLSTTPDILGALADHDVVVGSRAVQGATVTGRSRVRAGMHHTFKSQVRRFTGIAVSDPQCGFKAFHAEAAKTLFHLSRVDGFGFDVEMLLLARKLGLRIGEVPVNWTAVEGSKVRPLRDPISMAFDIGVARARLARRTPAQTLPLP